MRISNQNITNHQAQFIRKADADSTQNELSKQQFSTTQNDSLEISDEAKKLYNEAKTKRVSPMAVKSYTTTIYFKGYDITFEVRPGNINIENDRELKNLLRDSSMKDLTDLSSRMKDIYKRHIGKTFNVSNTSMALEILAHVYPDEFADYVNDNINLLPKSIRDDVRDVLEQLKDRTRVINIGENDKERSVFDTIGKYIDFFDLF